MIMSIIDQEEKISKLKKLDNPTSRELRSRVQETAKDFKTAWVELAQALYAIHRDRLYEYWGYERFEHYVEREVGLQKSLALKLVNTYSFVEQQEPQFLQNGFLEQRDAAATPELDAIHVLRLARNKKELTKHDYADLHKQVFEKGKGAAAVRKELTAIMKERKPVNPDEERAQRTTASVRRLLNAIRSFKKDAETLKLIRADIVKRAEELVAELEAEIE
jgi:hypothetical protein